MASSCRVMVWVRRFLAFLHTHLLMRYPSHRSSSYRAHIAFLGCCRATRHRRDWCGPRRHRMRRRRELHLWDIHVFVSAHHSTFSRIAGRKRRASRSVHRVVSVRKATEDRYVSHSERVVISGTGQSPVRSIAGGCAQARDMCVCSGPIRDRKSVRRRSKALATEDVAVVAPCSKTRRLLVCPFSRLSNMPKVEWGCPPSCGRTSQSNELKGS